jgi:hypothetical protein
MPDDLDPQRRAQAWSDARDRVVRLVYDAAADIDRTVPATPDWTVTDLLAHMVGVGVETVAATATDGHPAAWTATTVADRRGRSIDDLLIEWDGASAAIIEAIATDAQPGLLIDLATHEQDMRGALNRPGHRTGDAADATFAFYVEAFVDAARELPGLTVIAGDSTLKLGTGLEVGSMQVDPFELQRAAAGRRSGHQVRGWLWPVEPSPWVRVISRYGALHQTDLIE